MEPPEKEGAWIVSSMEVVEKIYAESVARSAPEVESRAVEFARDTTVENFFRLKLALERVERDIAVRDALRVQIGAFS